MTLSSIVRDDASVAENVLADVLRPLLEITPGGELLPHPIFFVLSPGAKVLAVLVAIKAMHILKIRTEESAGPTEISNLGGIPVGSVKPEVRRLQRENLIMSRQGRYHVPLRSISLIADRLSKEIGIGH